MDVKDTRFLDGDKDLLIKVVVLTTQIPDSQNQNKITKRSLTKIIHVMNNLLRMKKADDPMTIRSHFYSG